MSDIEKTIVTMARILLTDDPDEVESAKQNLRVLLRSVSAVAEDRRKKSMGEHIRELLFEMGAPDHLLGYQYTIDAVTSVIEDPSRLNKVIYDLYPPLALKHNTAVASFDCAIRRLIDAVFERGDIDILTGYFGSTIDPKKGRPTNSAFIARVANIVKTRMAE